MQISPPGFTQTTFALFTLITAITLPVIPATAAPKKAPAWAIEEWVVGPPTSLEVHISRSSS